MGCGSRLFTIDCSCLSTLLTLRLFASSPTLAQLLTLRLPQDPTPPHHHHHHHHGAARMFASRWRCICLVYSPGGAALTFHLPVGAQEEVEAAQGRRSAAACSRAQAWRSTQQLTAPRWDVVGDEPWSNKLGVHLRLSGFVQGQPADRLRLGYALEECVCGGGGMKYGALGTAFVIHWCVFMV